MPLATAFLQHFATKYPSYRLIHPWKDLPDHFLIVDKSELYRWRKGEIDTFFEFPTKTLVKNGKSNKYWVLGGGALIPCANTILTAFNGVRPGNYTLHFKDGNRDNCNLDNICWKAKENKDGQIRGITFDKSKNRWRVCRVGLKRSCHKTKEEAIQAVINQGATVEVEADEPDEPEGVIEPDEPDEDEPTAEELALHDHYDKQFEENEKRIKAEAEAFRLKSVTKPE